jgi:ATP-dependent Clp protease ATP-binding subunit ClpA
MFERYTEKARRVIFFARYEASRFGSATIDTEHLLLGILRESPNLLSESLDTIRIRIEEQMPIREKTPTSTDLPFSYAAKRVLNFASEEANRFGHPHIGTDHLLLGLLREKEGLAAKLLAEMGVQLKTFREVIPLSATEEPVPGALSESFGFVSAHPKPFESIPAPRVSGRPVPNAEFNQAIADAIDEARLLLRASAGPEHLLLGLLRNERSLATKILHEHDLDLKRVRERLKEP